MDCVIIGNTVLGNYLLCNDKSPLYYLSLDTNKKKMCQTLNGWCNITFSQDRENTIMYSFDLAFIIKMAVVRNS